MFVIVLAASMVSTHTARGQSSAEKIQRVLFEHFLMGRNDVVISAVVDVGGDVPQGVAPSAYVLEVASGRNITIVQPSLSVTRDDSFRMNTIDFEDVNTASVFYTDRYIVYKADLSKASNNWEITNIEYIEITNHPGP